ncbi:hypothetical protein [Aliarcobacter butzleri]|uniref:hypothetical protein n=1 Tax=Aliarcobacter butzleri TaxID=28197 RepID=UPI00263D5A2D|nr:hypothetical protein [Aliarcobacter butzleri]MDN5088747.1 hypothetical protein [Aliarcobacter butzleri]
MKKELIIFIVILIVLTMTMHYKEFINYPLTHLKNFPNSSAYGFGIFHPLVFTSIIYIVLSIPRLVITI